MRKQSQGTARMWAARLPKPAKGQADYAAPNSEHGLHIRVFATGRKVWFIRGRLKGSGAAPLFVALGNYSEKDFPYTAAEDAARRTRERLRQGVDPIAERREAASAARVESMTFGALVEEYLEKGTANLRANTLKGRRLALRGKRFADWHDKPLPYITAGRVKVVADSIPPSSHAVCLGSLRRVLNYAVDNGYLERAPAIKVERPGGDAAPFFTFQEGGQPDFAELAVVLEALDVLAQQQPLSPWPQMWKFGCLTGARPSAYQGLRWEELDLENAPQWRLPAARSKLKRDITIPLSDAAADLLRALPRRDSGLVWPGKIQDQPREDLPGDQVGLIRGMLASKGFREGFWPGRFRDNLMTWLETQEHASDRAIAAIVDHRAKASSTIRGRHYVKYQSDQLARKLVNEWAAVVASVRAPAVAKSIMLVKAA